MVSTRGRFYSFACCIVLWDRIVFWARIVFGEGVSSLDADCTPRRAYFEAASENPFFGRKVIS